MPSSWVNAVWSSSSSSMSKTEQEVFNGASRFWKCSEQRETKFDRFTYCLRLLRCRSTSWRSNCFCAKWCAKWHFSFATRMVSPGESCHDKPSCTAGESNSTVSNEWETFLTVGGSWPARMVVISASNFFCLSFVFCKAWMRLRRSWDCLWMHFVMWVGRNFPSSLATKSRRASWEVIGTSGNSGRSSSSPEVFLLGVLEFSLWEAGTSSCLRCTRLPSEAPLLSGPDAGGLPVEAMRKQMAKHRTEALFSRHHQSNSTLDAQASWKSLLGFTSSPLDVSAAEISISQWNFKSQITNWFIHPLGANSLQVTGYRLQVTGYRLQVTGYRLQVTGYRLQVTGYRLQVTGYRLQVTGLQVTGLQVTGLQVTGYRLQVTGYRLQVTGLQVYRFTGLQVYRVTGYRLQVTGYRLQVTGYRLQVTGYRLQVTGYRLQVTGYRLRVTGYRLRVTGYGLQVTGYGLQVKGYRLRVTG